MLPTSKSSFLLSTTDKNFIALNLNLVNCEDLNRILKFKIFLHKDGQLRAAQVILGYKPISTYFQSPKHMIKAKGLHLTRIDVTVPEFLTRPHSLGTHGVELTAQ